MRPSERLTSVFLLALSAVTAAGAPGSAPLLLLAIAVALAGTWGLALAGVRSGLPGVVRDYLPVPIVFAVYQLLQPAIEALNTRRWDGVLAALDERWAAPLVEAWRGVLGRAAPFTDLVYAGYVSYYLLLVGSVVVVWFHRRDRYDGAVLTVLSGLYFSFAGYVAFPTSGPRLPAELESSLGGGAVSEAVRAFLRTAEYTTLDAFPSGHTACALVAAFAVGRAAPRWLWLFAPWTALMIFATVYIHVHYAFDVLGGLALAALVIGLDRPLRRALGAEEAPAADGGLGAAAPVRVRSS